MPARGGASPGARGQGGSGVKQTTIAPRRPLWNAGQCQPTFLQFPYCPLADEIRRGGSVVLRSCKTEVKETSKPRGSASEQNLSGKAQKGNPALLKKN